MKVTVSRNELSEALGLAGQASSVRTALPVLASIRLKTIDGGLSLLGCDGEMWAHATCSANVEDHGAVCVQTQLLLSIVQALGPGNVEFSIEGTTVFLRHGQSEWKMLALPADEFPEIPSIEPSSNLTFAYKELSHGIDSVIYAVSDDSSRPVLTGVLFSYDGEVLTMVATDTHRMAVHKIRREGIGSDITAIVPEKALKIIKALNLGEGEEITVTFDDTRLSVDIGRAKIIAQLLNGQYPNWERVIPGEYTRVWTADRQDLIENINRALILARDNANRIRFKGEGERVVISARSEDKGEAKEEVTVVSKNGDHEIAFNGRYVVDALKSMSGDGIRAEMTESSRPAILRPTEGSDETFCVVMPMAMG